MDFYYLPASPSCRSVLLTAKIIGVDLNLKVTNLGAGENRTPEFLKVRYLQHQNGVMVIIHTTVSLLINSLNLKPFRLCEDHS